MHKPVLLKETIEELIALPSGNYLDCTFGCGGHSKNILSKLNANGKLYALDCDFFAIKIGEQLMEQDSRFQIYHGNFKNLNQIAFKNKFPLFDGVLFDLGVSSPQLDDPSRGFSYHNNGNLDMRMNQNEKLSASELINNLSAIELKKIFQNYGEAKHSRSIAQAIVKNRIKKPIQTTTELTEIIMKSLPKSMFFQPKHPAKVYFQALRIATNNELENFKIVLESIGKILAINAKVLIITFNSLEDKIIQEWMKKVVGIIHNFNNPIIIKKEFQLLKKPLTPTKKEVEDNRRSRSAKLWIFQKWK